MLCGKSFTETVKTVANKIEEIIIVAILSDELKVIAPITENIVAITPYTGEIETISKNIKAIKDALAHAKAAKEMATVSVENANISVNAKDISLQKAREANDDANAAKTSALFANTKAEYVRENITPILEHIEVIKLSPLNAKDAKKYANISVNAKDISLQKAREANDDANAAKTSALFANVQREKSEDIFNAVGEEKLEILGFINEHKDFIALSTKNIEDIRNVIFRKANEMETARVQSFDSANRAKESEKIVLSAEVKAKSSEAKALNSMNATKSAEANVKSMKAIITHNMKNATDVQLKTEEYYDETKKMHDFLVMDDTSVYGMRKEMYALRTGVINDTRGDILRR